MCYPRLTSIFPLYHSSAVMISTVSDVQKAGRRAAVSQEVGSKGKKIADYSLATAMPFHVSA